MADKLYEVMTAIRPLIEATTLSGHNARVDATHYVVRQLQRMLELEAQLAAANALLKRCARTITQTQQPLRDDLDAHLSVQEGRNNG